MKNLLCVKCVMYQHFILGDHHSNYFKYYFSFRDREIDDEESQVLAQGHTVSKWGFTEPSSDCLQITVLSMSLLHLFFLYLELINICSKEYTFSLFHLKSQTDSQIKYSNSMIITINCHPLSTYGKQVTKFF